MVMTRLEHKLRKADAQSDEFNLAYLNDQGQVVDSSGQVVGGGDEATIRDIVQDELATMESFGFSAAPIPGLGRPINDFKTTGTDFDFALDATGNPTVGTWGTVPADACALEFWSNGAASDDVIFWATRSGSLSTVGVLATNITNNEGATNPSARRLSSGEHIVLPLTTVGAVDALFRFAGGKSTARMQGRFISANTRFPYSMNSGTESLITGAGASAQFPFSDASRFPVGTIGVMLQVKGSGGVRARYDGGVPSASYGDLLPNGNYFIDYDRHGVSISALRLFAPVGTWIVANALKART